MLSKLLRNLSCVSAATPATRSILRVVEWKRRHAPQQPCFPSPIVTPGHFGGKRHRATSPPKRAQKSQMVLRSYKDMFLRRKPSQISKITSRCPLNLTGIAITAKLRPLRSEKEVLRSHERYDKPASGPEPSQAKTAHRSGHTGERPRLVGPVRQPQGLHPPVGEPAPGSGPTLPLPT